ncbi:MAG TPA: cyclic nucleotide-binding domain-containing protein [Usitatibacter sp.]|nr:cyclic nucleotide-binding domain-containing protein [Usitatibacter sp.]
MTDEFDFTRPQPAQRPAPAEPSAPSAPFKPAQSRYYDPKVAEALFRKEGKPERFAAGQALFVEEEKTKGGLFRSAARMYFLVEGEVALTHRGRALDTVRAGEVFGEMAVVSARPRSATATAKTDGAAISLDRGELQDALARSPEFALMLMSVMFDRLRFLVARLAARKGAGAGPAREATVFDAATLAQFEQALPRASTVRHWNDTVVMREGQSGAFMYVVKSGRVAISIRGGVVEIVQPGGIFGEMALVDQAPRAATATTQVECELLQVDRPSLLAAVRGHPAIAMAMLRGIAERVRYMNEQLN